jgi:hypothetical protein
MRNRAVLLLVACTLSIAGCPSQPSMPLFDSGSGGDGGAGDGGIPGDDASMQPDTGMDGGPVTSDAGRDAAASPDGGSDAGPSDAGPPVDANLPDAGRPVIPTSDPAPPATVVRMGTSGLLLRGTVLTPTGILSPGEVLIAGNTITCVATDCTTTAPSTATIIDTHATISPGLIDGHNHLTYDFLGEWVAPHLYNNRYEWRGDPSYSAWVDPEGDSDNNGPLCMAHADEASCAADTTNICRWGICSGTSCAVHPTQASCVGDTAHTCTWAPGPCTARTTQDTGSQCPGAKWGELRSIIHGTTTVQGEAPSSSCLDRLARNADTFTGLGADIGRTTISGACESGFPTRASLIGSFTAATNPVTRFYVHMGEGYANAGTATRTNPLREFDCFDGTDPMYPPPPAGSLLENPSGMPYGTAVFIHAMPLTAAQLDRTFAQGAHVVWSPSSNIVLYGQTADIAGMLSRGITVGLGPDWTPSGSDEMLSEMRFAQQYGMDHGIAALTAEQIWRMSTVDGADVTGMTPVGTLVVGQRADISVFGRTSTDPYQAVIDSRADDVRLVLIDGVGYYGDATLQAATAVNSFCEALNACGTPKYICAANTPGSMTATSRYTETVADIRGQLTTILAAWGRTDLQELVDCSL